MSIGLLINKFVELNELLVVLLNPDVAIVELCFKRPELCSKIKDYFQANRLMHHLGRRKIITQSFGA